MADHAIQVPDVAMAEMANTQMKNSCETIACHAAEAPDQPPATRAREGEIPAETEERFLEFLVKVRATFEDSPLHPAGDYDRFLAGLDLLFTPGPNQITIFHDTATLFAAHIFLMEDFQTFFPPDYHFSYTFTRNHEGWQISTPAGEVFIPTPGLLGTLDDLPPSNEASPGIRSTGPLNMLHHCDLRSNRKHTYMAQRSSPAQYESRGSNIFKCGGPVIRTVAGSKKEIVEDVVVCLRDLCAECKAWEEDAVAAEESPFGGKVFVHLGRDCKAVQGKAYSHVFFGSEKAVSWDVPGKTVRTDVLFNVLGREQIASVYGCVAGDCKVCDIEMA